MGRVRQEVHRTRYEKWKDETEYGKRFSEEQEMASLVSRFKDKIRARSRQVILKLLNARIVVHNLFTALSNDCRMLNLDEPGREIREPTIQTSFEEMPDEGTHECR